MLKFKSGLGLLAPLAPLVIVLVLTGCASLPQPAPGPLGPAPTDIPPLVVPGRSSGERMNQEVMGTSASSSALAPGWEPYIIHRTKRNTQYTTDRRLGVASVKAQSKASASGWAARVDIDPQDKPILQWQWKVAALIPSADNTERATEDSPVRIVLAFAGDKSTLPFKDQAFFERAKLIAGRDLPYATLMYIWENKAPVDTIIPNAHSGRIQKIVAESGQAGVGQWRKLERDIVKDYQAAFGTMPGKLIGVAILTDTDNTGESVTSWYGNIEVKPRPAR